MLSRAIVPAHRVEELSAAIAAEMQAVRIGSPLDPATEMGPIAMKRQLERIESYVEIGQREGAACGAGGCVHVGVACFGDDGCDLLGMGRHHFDLPAGGGRHPGAIDEQAVGVAQGDAFGKFKRHVRSSINV